MIRSGLKIGAPEDAGLYLGCRHVITTVPGPVSGESVRRLEYNMEEFLVGCVARYRELTGVTELKPVTTPFIDESREPVKLGEKGKERKIVEEPALQEGKYKAVAARVLMKILYAARVARFDLLRAVNNLSCFVTKWDTQCDKRLHRLVCYIQSTLHLRQTTWVGDCLQSCSLNLYADASFSECLATARSTSGVFFCVNGPSTFGSLTGLSKRQHCVSHSTPEAEIVAADFALRTVGLPALSIWELIGGVG